MKKTLSTLAVAAILGGAILFSPDKASAWWGPGWGYGPGWNNWNGNNWNGNNWNGNNWNNNWGNNGWGTGNGRARGNFGFNMSGDFDGDAGGWGNNNWNNWNRWNNGWNNGWHPYHRPWGYPGWGYPAWGYGPGGWGAPRGTPPANQNRTDTAAQSSGTSEDSSE